MGEIDIQMIYPTLKEFHTINHHSPLRINDMDPAFSWLLFCPELVFVPGLLKAGDSDTGRGPLVVVLPPPPPPPPLPPWKFMLL